MAKKHLIIIDGNALIHRAWHALPPLTAKDGTVVSGAYGFTMILLKAIKEIKPTHVAVTFDLPGPTFRHEEYADYKAKRVEQPDELYEQIPMAEEIMEAMDIPVYTAKGFEADDVIGTIVTRVSKEQPDIESIIVTGDKDSFQLVEENIKVYTLRKGMTDTVIYDIEGIEEKTGLKPEQQIDYKALRGDPSDNIPGVRGVGDKTAVMLLTKYGDIDSIYGSIEKGDEKAQELRDTLKQKLIDGKKDAMRARGLCEIRRDVDMEFDIKDAEYRTVTQEQMKEIFERYQFLRLLKQLPSIDSDEGRKAAGQMGLLEAKEPRSQGAKEPVEKSEKDIVVEGSEVKKIFGEFTKADRIASRTMSDDDGLKYLAMCVGTGVNVFSGEAVRGAKKELSELFADKKKEFVCHDLKNELSVLADLGIEMKGQAFDLMIASYLLHAGERRHSLDSMLSFHRNVSPLDKKADDEARAERLRQEVGHFMSLADELSDGLEKEGLTKLNLEVEIPLSFVLSRMERNGVTVDVEYLGELSVDLEKKLARLTKKIYRLAGDEFNINSPAQLKEVLFEKLEISTEGIKKTQKGGTLSTAASELAKLKNEHEIIGHILSYRELTKLKSTYVDALPPLTDKKDGRIHADFNQTVTATGRLSSSNPNMQNIPTAGTEYGKKVRNAFVASKGYTLLAADYSQVELRIAAHIAKEEHMIKAFKDGEDIHWRTAVEMFGEDEAKDRRRVAKAINFGILYGMGANRLAESAEISFAEAREYIETYFALHAGIDEYIRSTKEKANEEGYVETLFGRKRFFPNIHLMNPRERAEAERQAVNMPIQGTSADMIKMAMVSLDRIVGEKYGFGPDAEMKMIMQVHDELVFEVKTGLVKEVTEMVKNEMEGVTKLSVPIVVDIATAKRWGEMKK
ncbi:MAG: DNA polymerase I [Patescibacteria group bacterium]|nr:DNA polymerase I [Patescibacteria group bacterium]